MAPGRPVRALRGRRRKPPQRGHRRPAPAGCAPRTGPADPAGTPGRTTGGLHPPTGLGDQPGLLEHREVMGQQIGRQTDGLGRHPRRGITRNELVDDRESCRFLECCLHFRPPLELHHLLPPLLLSQEWSNNGRRQRCTGAVVAAIARRRARGARSHSFVRRAVTQEDE